MGNLNSIKDLENRALVLRDNGSSLVLFSLEYRLYMEIDFCRQLTVVNEYADIDKAYLINILHSLLVNNGKIDVSSECSENIELLKVFRYPDGISYINTEKILVYFIDRGNILQKREKDILNKLLVHSRTVVMFARADKEALSLMPLNLATLEVKQVEGIDCFFIK